MGSSDSELENKGHAARGAISTETPDLSVVAPVFNEEGNVPVFVSSLREVLDEMGLDYEIIIVDDGSQDGSFAVVRDHSEADPRVKGLSLSRNFGHQVALTAGLRAARGNCVVTMDADLQHPPQLVPELYRQHQAGFDIVNTRRIDAESTGVLKKWTSKLYYRIINLLSDVQVDPATADFRLLGRKAVDAFLRMPERDRFTRGLVKWLGFDQSVVEYRASPRFSGTTKYSFFKMLKLGIDGIISFSAKPLRLAVLSGFFVIGAGVLYGIYAVVNHFQGDTIEGWTSLLITVLILGGVQLVSLGIMGEYIIRIFNEAKARPLYVVKDQTDNLECPPS